MLAKFFQSSDYLVGSGTQLKFHDDGVACLRVIKEYVEDGTDIYTADRLRRYATQETVTYKVYDFLLVVCVHKLAAKLAVHSLMNLAYAVLYQLECSVTPRDFYIYIYLYNHPQQTSERLPEGSHTAQLFRYLIDPGEHIILPRIITAQAIPLEEI